MYVEAKKVWKIKKPKQKGNVRNEKTNGYIVSSNYGVFFSFSLSV